MILNEVDIRYLQTIPMDVHVATEYLSARVAVYVGQDDRHPGNSEVNASTLDHYHCHVTTLDNYFTHVSVTAECSTSTAVE